ncbi:Gfo/Idh/MocA family protein [Planctomicrobium sp. SH664]|uniref:Gfo/Idh/MocA family protein n=1 Tax=Planctomicrobium sp. SH664 TaxID=3448125 RepID=UPI003F5ADEF1
MSLTRRHLLKSAAAVAAGAVIAPNLVETAQGQPPSSSPNEKIGMAVIGTGGRGGEHLSKKGFAGREDVEILYLCDVDPSAAGGKVNGVEKLQGRAPQVIQDFRKVLEDPRVDAVSIATPNHWHSLGAILALQAGKHVYVEKPVSHNVWEGRQLVGWARKLNKLCQCGTQSRSSPALQAALKWGQAGNLGKLQYAIGTCYKPRPSIGKLSTPLAIPKAIDYDLWCGPAAKVDIYRPRLHYDWHWDFNTGNGDLGNQGIHQMDIARWFLGENELSPRVTSIGGRVGYEDAGDTANEQIVMHGFERAPLLFETRGLPKKDMKYGGKDAMDVYRGSTVGVIVQYENGYFVIPSSYTTVLAFDNDGNPIQEGAFQGSGDHFRNFLDALHANDPKKLNADVLEGHLSSALCHTGNISHLLGKKVAAEGLKQAASKIPMYGESLQRMTEHLAANGVDITAPTLTLGPTLEMDPVAETFINNPEADVLLKRNYRVGYVVPAAS